MNEIPSLYTQYDKNGIPVLIKNPNLILYMDFCPSESLRENTPTPDSTFVCSACIFIPLQPGIESQIKKISEIRGIDRKIKYVNKIYGIIKEQKIALVPLCILTTEKEYYENALWHAACIHDIHKKTNHMKMNEAMAYYDNIATDMALKFNIKKNKFISIIGIFMSAYYAAGYFLKMMKLYQMFNPSSVKIIIDSPPGGIDNHNEIFNNIYESCFDKIHVKTTEHYKCPIEISIIKDNVKKDWAGLKLADMMAHISATSMVKKNPHDINAKINRSPQLPQYPEEVYKSFFLLTQLLRERKFIAEATIPELMMLNNLEKSGFVIPIQ